MIRALRLSPADDVAILVDAAAPGDRVLGIVARDAVPGGHKLALTSVPAGAPIRKYGQIIGIASKDIAAGEHVHTHNLVVEDRRHATAGAKSPPSDNKTPPPAPATFEGYVRADGKVGTRNAIGVIASVNCSATVVRRIARQFEDGLPPGIDAVVPITHSSGCGMSRSGEGFETLDRTLAGYARQPNFGGVLMIGLGCEVAQIDEMLARHGIARGRALADADDPGRRRYGRGDRARQRNCRGVDRDWPRATVEHGARRRSSYWACNAAGRTAGPASRPTRRSASLRTCWSPPAPPSCYRKRPRSMGPSICCWPAPRGRRSPKRCTSGSPGGSATPRSTGSVSTTTPRPATRPEDSRRYMKSRWARSPRRDPARWRMCCFTRSHAAGAGCVFMDSPGYDPCSATGQIASGANLLAFTTGRGSVFGAKPTPCLKIASNARLARAMSGDMDVDCSPILDGMTVAEAGDGNLSRASRHRLRAADQIRTSGLGDFEFVPWQLGAWHVRWPVSHAVSASDGNQHLSPMLLQRDRRRCSRE